MADKVGMSQNYLATRLRDEKPFTLDDLDAILRELGELDAARFITQAESSHGDDVLSAMLSDREAAKQTKVDGEPNQEDFILVANPRNPIEEQEGREANW